MLVISSPLANAMEANRSSSFIFFFLIQIEKERFITFMDALMAIIMTIMVLEIKIPAVETLTDETLRQELHKAVTPLIGFLVSFSTLIMIWMSHNDLMRDINGITKQF